MSIAWFEKRTANGRHFDLTRHAALDSAYLKQNSKGYLFLLSIRDKKRKRFVNKTGLIL